MSLLLILALALARARKLNEQKEIGQNEDHEQEEKGGGRLADTGEEIGAGGKVTVRSPTVARILSLKRSHNFAQRRR